MTDRLVSGISAFLLWAANFISAETFAVFAILLAIPPIVSAAIACISEHRSERTLPKRSEVDWQWIRENKR